ncbi:MAG: hypothetical protein DBW85_09745 [Synechococcus sp. MED-G71]|jgi:hypothetical protein|nr:MAG: hypothetical protein DBW85_09745 [Synechococcus sp. MED-G71]RPF77426.1 MAG: hypothetical protein CBD15_003145 [Synechococcus sp. TMED155]|tara:strand:+ start:4903 stop:5232 length:330 start_codon:yes stop_codon:yes gene_type:complete
MASSSSTSLNPDQLEQLEGFLKDWLRHSGRTQSDLRRALRAGSIRMPVLLQELQRTVVSGGVSALAERLCGIEAQWLSGVEEPEAGSPVAVDDMSQLDLLLKSIQNDAA